MWLRWAEADQLAQHGAENATGVGTINEFSEVVWQTDAVEEACQHLACNQIQNVTAQFEVRGRIDVRVQAAAKFGVAIVARVHVQAQGPVDQQPVQVGVDGLGGERALSGQLATRIGWRKSEGSGTGHAQGLSMRVRTVGAELAHTCYRCVSFQPDDKRGRGDSWRQGDGGRGHTPALLLGVDADEQFVAGLCVLLHGALQALMLSKCKDSAEEGGLNQRQCSASRLRSHAQLAKCSTRGDSARILRVERAF